MAHVEDLWIKKGQRTALYGKGSRYRARWAGPDGKEKTESFPDGRKKEALAYATGQETDIRRGTWIDPNAGKATLRNFAETAYLPSLNMDPSTRQRIEYQWRLHIEPSLGDKQLGYLAAHPSAVQQWVSGLTPGMAASSAKVVLSVLSGILAAALDDGIIHRNPVRTKRVQAPKRDQHRVIPWTAAQIAGVHDALEERYAAMVDVGSGLGLRQGEVFGFSPEDVDWLRQGVHVRRQIKFVHHRLCFAPPKGGRERDIPLPESIQLALAAHMSGCPAVPVTLPWGDPDGKLRTMNLFFTTRLNKPIRRGDFDSHRWIPAIEANGIIKGGDNGFHALRHYFASVLLNDGVDVRRLAEYLGHHNPAVTLSTYSHLMPNMESAMRQIIDRTRLAGADDMETTEGVAE